MATSAGGMFDGTTNHPPRWTRSWIGFTRLYAFLAHVVPVGSPDMERIYLYGRMLLPRLPSDDDEGIVDLSEAAILTHLRIEKSAFTDASLTTVSDQGSEQKGHTGAGQGRQYDDPSEPVVVDHRDSERPIRAQPDRGRPAVLRIG